MQSFHWMQGLSWKKMKKGNSISNFLTEKSGVTSKARKCSDGSKQLENMAKNEAISPTVTTDAIFITFMIDAKEGRQVAVVNLSRAYFHADNDENLTIFMRVRLAELMTMIAP